MVRMLIKRLLIALIAIASFVGAYIFGAYKGDTYAREVCADEARPLRDDAKVAFALERLLTVRYLMQDAIEARERNDLAKVKWSERMAVSWMSAEDRAAMRSLSDRRFYGDLIKLINEYRNQYPDSELRPEKAPELAKMLARGGW